MHECINYITNSRYYDEHHNPIENMEIQLWLHKLTTKHITLGYISMCVDFYVCRMCVSGSALKHTTLLQSQQIEYRPKTTAQVYGKKSAQHSVVFSIEFSLMENKKKIKKFISECKKVHGS